jgi:hypothetical protein
MRWYWIFIINIISFNCLSQSNYNIDVIIGWEPKICFFDEFDACINGVPISVNAGLLFKPNSGGSWKDNMLLYTGIYYESNWIKVNRNRIIFSSRKDFKNNSSPKLYKDGLLLNSNAGGCLRWSFKRKKILKETRSLRVNIELKIGRGRLWIEQSGNHRLFDKIDYFEIVQIGAGVQKFYFFKNKRFISGGIGVNIYYLFNSNIYFKDKLRGVEVYFPIEISLFNK